jgi:multidrug resistance efflux pump
VAWAALTDADLVVRGAGRVRPATSPHRVTNPVQGEALSATAGGRVVEVRFHEGDTVKRGDVLLRFDTERLTGDIAQQEQKLRLARHELAEGAQIDGLLARQFEAAKAKGKAELEQARETVRRTKERQAAEVEEVRAELKNARADEARLGRLAEQRAVARVDFIQAVTRRQVLERRLQRAEVPPEEGAVEAARQALAVQERDHALRREELALKRAAKDAEVRAAEIDLARLELLSRQAVVRAPVDGIVAAGEVKVGDLLEPGRTVLEIAEQNGFVFEAVVPGDEIGHLRVGMAARVKLDAFDYQKYGTLPGTVLFIAPDSGVARAGTPEGADSPRQPPASAYVVKIALEGDEVGRGQFTGRVKLGMAGRVEVVTDRESLLSLLARRIRRSISLG